VQPAKLQKKRAEFAIFALCHGDEAPFRALSVEASSGVLAGGWDSSDLGELADCWALALVDVAACGRGDVVRRAVQIAPFVMEKLGILLHDAWKKYPPAAMVIARDGMHFQGSVDAILLNENQWVARGGEPAQRSVDAILDDDHQWADDWSRGLFSELAAICPPSPLAARLAVESIVSRMKSHDDEAVLQRVGPFLPLIDEGNAEQLKAHFSAVRYPAFTAEIIRRLERQRFSSDRVDASLRNQNEH
jgi:hypothetical protein